MAKKKIDCIIHWLGYNSYEDINFHEIGWQDCVSDYGYGPIIRDKYILHYVISGDGALHLDGKIIPIHEKQAFIIPPGIPGYYQASTDNPWEYIWIQFYGPKAGELLQKAGLTREQPIFNAPDCFLEIERCLWDMMNQHAAEYYTMGKLYQFFQLLIDNSSHKKIMKQTADPSLQYIRTVIQYINEKYSEPIRIQTIADYCGLDRAYLSKLFKNATGQTPQRYLILFRIDKAKQLLADLNIPIQHVGYSIGYSDPLSFSKLFKQETGMSPTEYRAQIKPPTND